MKKNIVLEEELNKRIKKEKNKFKKIFKNIDENKKKFSETLINRLAWLTVQAEDLEKSIQSDGTQQIYDHGGGQKGLKANPDITTYNAYVKNIATITKQLTDLVPSSPKKSKLDRLLDD